MNTSIDIDMRQHGRNWIATFDGIQIEAAPTVGERSTIPAVLFVRRGDQVIDTDDVALAKARKRAAFLNRPAMKMLKPARAHLEQMLLQLADELKRIVDVRPPDHSAGAPAVVPSTSLGDVLPASIYELRDLVNSRLKLGDDDVLDVVMGTVKSHRASTGSPCWLMLVGPPSGLKSEIVMLAKEVRGTYSISGLTSKTFASGLKVDRGQKPPSLLAKLCHDEILLFKDFTTVLQMHREERDAILGQLREIYDGTYSHDWGTGERFEWSGRLGFVAGVTEAIDQHHAVMALLGPRFLLHRPSQAERAATALRAIRNNRDRDDGARRAMHARAAAAYLDSLPTTLPTFSDGVEDTLSRLADFVTTARSAVGRDGHTRELTYSPLPEMPGRFAQQISTLLSGVALVRQHDTVEADDVGLATRVALDCIPPIRLLALRALLQGEQDLSTSTLANNLRVPTTTITRAMEDLEALGLVRCERRGQGRQNRWSLLPAWRTSATEFLSPWPAVAATGHADDDSFLLRVANDV